MLRTRATNATFGDFAIDFRAGTITRRGRIVPLPHKAFLFLEALLRSGGELVSRQQLMLALWPDVHVEHPNNMNQAHAKVVRLIGHAFVETLKGQGYRFQGAVIFTVHKLPPLDPAPDGMAAA